MIECRVASPRKRLIVLSGADCTLALPLHDGGVVVHDRGRSQVIKSASLHYDTLRRKGPHFPLLLTAELELLFLRFCASRLQRRAIRVVPDVGDELVSIRDGDVRAVAIDVGCGNSVIVVLEALDVLGGEFGRFHVV